MVFSQYYICNPLIPSLYPQFHAHVCGSCSPSAYTAGGVTLFHTPQHRAFLHALTQEIIMQRLQGPLHSLYKCHEQAKKREYGERIRKIERGVFTHLVLSTHGAMGKEATTFYKQLADMLSQKRQQSYTTVMGWLRCRLSFAYIRASILCICGSRSSINRPAVGSNIQLATSEGRVPSEFI